MKNQIPSGLQHRATPTATLNLEPAITSNKTHQRRIYTAK